MIEVAVATMAASVPTAMLNQPKVRAVVGSDRGSSASVWGPEVKGGGSEAGALELTGGGGGFDAHAAETSERIKP